MNNFNVNLWYTPEPSLCLAMFTLPKCSEINRHRPCNMQVASCARKLNVAPDLWWIRHISVHSNLSPGGYWYYTFQKYLAWRTAEYWAGTLKPNFSLFSVFSCLLPSLSIFWFHSKNIQHNLTLKRKKQENTEQVRSLVLKFLSKIRLCVTVNATATCNLNTPRHEINLTFGFFKANLTL